MRETDSDDENTRSSRPSVRELEVLHAVITTRKTTAAAQRLGGSQPAVSRAIGALEARLGRELFIRDGGRLVPTADAFALDAEAAPIFSALERLAEVDEVVFDKTGTLTLGRPTLKGAEGIAPEALALAAALARVSAHPRSVAIADAARALGLPPAPLEEATEYPGLGIEGIVGGRKVRLGRAEWAGDIGAAAPQPTGATLLVVDGGAATPFRFEDTIRPGAQALIAHLAERGLPVTLLSGDTPQAVAHLADQLGITTWRAGMLPHEKAEYLEGRAAAGQRVMMVGDGLNDTAAIATAHVSIAPASALEATRVAADVVLVSPDLSHIADALRIGGRARRRILENFVIAGVYNAISIPIAFLGFATPLAAAIAMSTSSIVVSLNALRTR